MSTRAFQQACTTINRYGSRSWLDRALEVPGSSVLPVTMPTSSTKPREVPFQPEEYARDGAWMGWPGMDAWVE